MNHSGTGERVNAVAGQSATVQKNAETTERVKIEGRYHAVCMRVVPERMDEAQRILARMVLRSARAARLFPPRLAVDALNFLDQRRFDALPRFKLWDDDIINVVTTVGANDVLDKYLAGSAYTAAVFMGLKGTGTAVIGDTQASHAGWLEQGGANAPTYSGTRKTPAFSAAAAKVKATSAAVAFTFTGSGTVFGCFINQGGTSAIDNATGILVSAGDFSNGSKAVVSTDVVNVTYSLGL
jgi:hypothetical protein